MSLTVAMLGFLFLMAMLLARSWTLSQRSLPNDQQCRPLPERRTAAALQASHPPE